jgi:predicted short-subunit dehydrogenase-like oxidoreductase (DUF2520 family)
MLPGMPPRQRRKPRITIVGAGNLAGALAVSFSRAGYSIDQIISRRLSASLERARRLALEVGSSAVAVGQARVRAEVVWFCVPDAAIFHVAQALAGAAEWKGKVALHSSGALTSDQLAGLRARGAAVASVHPLMTFVAGSRPTMVDVPFTLEGDTAAVRVAREIVRNLRGIAYSIRKEDKPAYHAWGTFASPLFTALLVTSEHVASTAGIKRKAAKERMLPILKQTLTNYAAFDETKAFSGPFIRGDIDTIKRHLSTLHEIPVAREVYASLARAALTYLPGKNKKALEQTLKLSPRRTSRKRSRRS